MNDKVKIILTATGVLAAGIALMVLLTTQGEDPDTSQSPTPTISASETPDASPAPSEPAPAPSETHSEDDGHAHNHDDPLPSEDEPEQVNSIEDMNAAIAVKPAVKTFVTEWLTLDPNETTDQRQARLTSAGASPEVASSTTRIERKDAGYVSVSVVSEPQPEMMSLLLKREDGLLKIRTAVNVDFTETIATGASSHHIAGGTVTVWVTDDGKVMKVEESFPTL